MVESLLLVAGVGNLVYGHLRQGVDQPVTMYSPFMVSARREGCALWFADLILADLFRVNYSKSSLLGLSS
jgi:hypothetical protein